MSPSAAPPSPQEIHRKLSVHSVARSVAKPPSVSTSDAPVSGTESDSDSVLSPAIMGSQGQGISSSLHVGTAMQPPLSSIAERSPESGEDSDEEEEEEGGWKSADIRAKPRDSVDEGVIKSGYLWKKGERRKTWKKRWFVLRPAHLAYYKNSAEYQLLRLLELSDVHSCTRVTLKRHENTFGLVSPVRTFYLQAKTPVEVQEWVTAIEEARQSLTATSTLNSISGPIPIPTPTRRSPSHLAPPISSSPPNHASVPARGYNVTSSDSEDASPNEQRGFSTSSNTWQAVPPSPIRPQGSGPGASSKVILSGYLMKCGSKRRNWRKRWFVLTGEKLVYSGSHMDTKPHRQFSFAQILDALEYTLPPNRHVPATPMSSLPLSVSPASEMDDPHGSHTFKIVTTKRALLLCAPTEEDEIKWLGAVRALIARRSEAGAVPGESTPHAIITSRSVDGQSSGVVAGGSGSKTKVRRLSASASGGGTIPEEGGHERP